MASNDVASQLLPSVVAPENPGLSGKPVLPEVRRLSHMGIRRDPLLGYQGRGVCCQFGGKAWKWHGVLLCWPAIQSLVGFSAAAALRHEVVLDSVDVWRRHIGAT